MTRQARLGSVLAAVLVAGCAGSSTAKSPAARATAAIEPAAPRARDAGGSANPGVSFEALGEIFGTADPTAPSSTPGVADYRAFVRRRLADPKTYKTLMPQFFPAARLFGFSTDLVSGWALKEGVTKTKKKFFYRHAPCDDRALERVHPWWQPAIEVWVCRDDYRPTVLADGTMSCDVTHDTAPIDSTCGCGPQLMFCATEDVADALREATLDELRLTLKYVIESDRPYSDLYAMPQTVRPGLADLYYARLQFFQTGQFVPPDVDRPAALLPKSELAKGGILSTPIYMFGDLRRPTLVQVLRDVLCLKLRGRGVDTQKLLDTMHTDGNLRNKSLMVLATTEGCQNCHASLENTQVAYSGWQSPAEGMHFVPPDPSIRAKLYVRDHEDLRAEGPADLAWLGKAFTSQPEFAECVVSKVTDLIYEGRDPPIEVVRELSRHFGDGQHLELLIEDAVVARAFGARALRATAITPRDPEMKR